MPNNYELLKNIASQLSEKAVGDVWFTVSDLENAYSQLILDNFTSKQSHFGIVGGNITGTYQFLSEFYRLGDMPNELQIVMDSTIGQPFTNVYLDDILISSKGSLEEHKER